MKKNHKDFHILRAIDLTALFLILLFLGVFIKVILSVVGVFQSEGYTTIIASVSSAPY